MDALGNIGPHIYHRTAVTVSAGTLSYIIDVDRVDERGMLSRTGRWRLTIRRALYSTLPQRDFPVTYHADPDAAVAQAWQLITGR